MTGGVRRFATRTRRLALNAGLLLALPALSFAAEPKSTPARASANGEWTIRMTDFGDGVCRIEAQRQTSIAWILDRCLGTVDDLFLISNTGQRFWVLKTLPEKPPPVKVKGRARPQSWEGVVVARLFDKDGNLLQERRAADLVAGRHREEVRHLARHFKWLEGVVGVPGKGPRLNDKNQVELETVGSRTVKLAFAED